MKTNLKSIISSVHHVFNGKQDETVNSSDVNISDLLTTTTAVNAPKQRIVNDKSSRLRAMLHFNKPQRVLNKDSISRKISCNNGAVTRLVQRSMLSTAPALMGSQKQTDPNKPLSSQRDAPLLETTPSPYPTEIIETPRWPARPIANFRSEGRGDIGMSKEFFRTQEELNMAGLTDNKLKEAPQEVIDNVMLYFAGNRDPEKLSRLYEQMPLYSSPLVSPGEKRIMFRGTNLREREFNEVISLFPHDPYRAGRFFTHGRDLPDGTRSHHGVVSASTSPDIAHEFLKWKRAEKKAPILIKFTVLGARPGVHYGAEGIAPSINMRPTTFAYKDYPEHEVLLSRTNMYKMLSIERKGDKEHGDHILIEIQVSGPLLP